jgi:hypothetical protein
MNHDPLGYNFETDMDSRTFCDEITDIMSQKYGLTMHQSVTRINRLWEGDPFVGDDMRYHRPAESWADHIYQFYEQYPVSRNTGLPKAEERDERQ